MTNEDGSRTRPPRVNELIASVSALLPALTAGSFVLSVAYDIGYFARLGINPGVVPTTLSDHTKSALLWLPLVGKPTLYSHLWGLVPYWSKDPKKGVRPVNAKAETAHERPLFKKLIRERRCLIPANCYYEWKQMPVGKRPYCIRMEDESRSSSAACDASAR